METLINYSPKIPFKQTMKRKDPWLKRFNQIIENHPQQTSINNAQLARKLAVSERELFRKVRKATGCSPQKYLRQIRLAKSLEYLEEGTYRTVSEVAFAIGYVNVSYFIQQFEQEFGKRPLQVLQEAGWR